MSIKIYVKYVKNNRDFHTTKLNLPTGNLDVDTAAGIVKIFKELAHEDKKCVIAVTHSEAFAAEADVVVRLEKKKLQD